MLSTNKGFTGLSQPHQCITTVQAGTGTASAPGDRFAPLCGADGTALGPSGRSKTVRNGSAFNAGASGAHQ
jgi:hypothetical protein